MTVLNGVDNSKDISAPGGFSQRSEYLVLNNSNVIGENVIVNEFDNTINLGNIVNHATGNINNSGGIPYAESVE